MRYGDFGELLTDPEVLSFFGGPVQIFDHLAAGDSARRSPAIASTSIWAAAISAIGRNFVNLFPLPNQTGPNGSTVFRNYLASSESVARTDYYVTKITQALSDSRQLNFSYSYRKLPSVKGGFPRLAPPFVAQGVWQQQFRSYYARLQHDYTITSTLLNHFNAGFTRSDVANRNYSSSRTG